MTEIPKQGINQEEMTVSSVSRQRAALRRTVETLSYENSFLGQLEKRAQRTPVRVIIPNIGNDVRARTAAEEAMEYGVVENVEIVNDSDLSPTVIDDYKQRLAENMRSRDSQNPKKDVMDDDFYMKKANDLMENPGCRTATIAALKAYEEGAAFVGGSTISSADIFYAILGSANPEVGRRFKSTFLLTGDGNSEVLRDNGRVLWAVSDPALNERLLPEQVAECAFETAQVYKGVTQGEPRVAFLSYSTGDSGHGDAVEEARQAANIAWEKYPDLKSFGPIQFDAAVQLLAYQIKRATINDNHDLEMFDRVAGPGANVLQGRQLNGINPLYKAISSCLSKSAAIGPIVVPFARIPISDLSRGSQTKDIYYTMTALSVMHGERLAGRL